MPLSWNEIKERAITFSKDWENTVSEDAEAKPFLEAFFNVFGISRKKIATFEHKVRKLNEHDGYIDLFWKGTMLVEMKSRGKDLEKAFIQAKEYIQKLKQEEIPKYILVSDFAQFNLYDLEKEINIEFTLKDLVNNVQHFGFIAGYEQKTYEEQDPVNIKAAELMGKLHDRLKEIGYEGHPLEVYLVRVLFCLFAEDTTIFEKQLFQDYIEQRTNEDGSDLAAKIQELFQVLNTPKEKRFKNLDEQLNKFPFVNGKLFEETLPIASFDSKMRYALLECCHLDWSLISPAIFGSMFQAVMNKEERRNLGAHYTSEKNILKLIEPLFLDELYEEFESVKGNRNRLIDFHKKLGNLKFLDPACGCGNFLVITYRELRILEIKVLKVLSKKEMFTNIKNVALIDVDQMYGIEIEDFPARVAEVAMWLIDHQMNQKLSKEFGMYFLRLPLQKAANIVHANALRTDWGILLRPRIIETYFYDMGKKEVAGKVQTVKDDYSYILGNPPFVGKYLQNQEQKDDLDLVFKEVKGAGVLDYVAAWYLKVAEYIQNSKIKAAFVSTNSITQGEQVGVLWNELFFKYKIKIHFAHRTFKWSNEAKGNAAVHVVIVGFANFDTNKKNLFEYEDTKGEAHKIPAKNINPYLVEGKDFVILKRRTPISNVPEISFGSMPNDGGNFLFTDEEKKEFLKLEPNAKKFMRPLISGYEFLNGENRWCLWLKDAEPQELKELKEVRKRIEAVQNLRQKSNREATKKLAAFPQLFGEIRQPDSSYIAIPRVSSEKRKFIPIGFFSKDYILSDTCLYVASQNLLTFGILQSTMHMCWVRSVCGRLKSDYRYSNEIVYNNYPWPLNPTEKQTKAIEMYAQKVLDARKEFPDSSLATLYDPLSMPPKLTKAHQELDKAVDAAYRSQPFTSEAKRMEFLFELYEKYTVGLFAKEKV
ncbi:MAG: class I SAM-dependent DNA methyltransferase [Leptospiraceae bacterium]|nr:class I SAM-dependent DNA methyltransferase [Leptospiraceae bacterium]MCK6380382.1 class I SAM-dependent DNA methyltransferase [Leptospiraceae bacterium]NUM41781.1 class I SAM-dependent DNA methyltransferase [Leptospiraceae bacterium]